MIIPVCPSTFRRWRRWLAAGQAFVDRPLTDERPDDPGRAKWSSQFQPSP